MNLALALTAVCSARLTLLIRMYIYIVTLQVSCTHGGVRGIVTVERQHAGVGQIANAFNGIQHQVWSQGGKWVAHGSVRMAWRTSVRHARLRERGRASQLEPRDGCR